MAWLLPLKSEWYLAHFPERLVSFLRIRPQSSFRFRGRALRVLRRSPPFPSFPTSWLLRWHKAMRHFDLSELQRGPGSFGMICWNIPDAKRDSRRPRISYWSRIRVRNLRHGMAPTLSEWQAREGQLHVCARGHSVSAHCFDVIGITSAKVSKATTLPFVLY